MPNKIKLSPIRTDPAYRITARVLRDKIVSGEIAIGSVLPSELAMSEQLQVNRSTVREAIRLLEETGIVGRKPGGKKLFVTAPTRIDLSNKTTTALVLNKITVEELWGVMMVLEPAAAAAAAHKVTEAQIEALDTNLTATASYIDDQQSILELDLEFHELIAQASGNRALQISRHPIGELFYPAFEAVFRRLNTGERLLSAHSTIVEGLKAGDAKKAEEWMQKHIVDFKRGYELANLDIKAPVYDHKTARVRNSS